MEVRDGDGTVVAGQLGEPVDIDVPARHVDGSPRELGGTMRLWMPDAPLEVGGSYTVSLEGRDTDIFSRPVVEVIELDRNSTADLEWHVEARQVPVGETVCCHDGSSCFETCYGIEGMRTVAQLRLAAPALGDPRLFRLEGQRRWAWGLLLIDVTEMASQACATVEIWDPQTDRRETMEHCEKLDGIDVGAVRMDWDLDACAHAPPMPWNESACFAPGACPVEPSPPVLRWCDEHLDPDWRKDTCEDLAGHRSQQACLQAVEERRMDAEVWCQGVREGGKGCSATPASVISAGWLAVLGLGLWRRRRSGDFVQQGDARK